MKADDINLERMLEYHPDAGKVMLGPDRMLIFRQQAMGVLRRLMYEQLGAKLARTILTQFGHQCGAGDYANLQRSYDWDTDLDGLTSGPVLHTWEGIVRPAPEHIEYDRASGRFEMTGEWLNSYEAEIHVAQLGVSDEPVCHSLTGYASGYATAFFGSPILAIETACVGKGDETCRFAIREVGRWGPEADPWKDALAATNVSLVRELQELTKRQRDALDELTTPILEIWDGIIALPIIGIVDTTRSQAIMTALLDAVAGGQCRCVILDVTGVDAVDTGTAHHLLQMVQAARLLGAYCVITGVSPSVAQTLVAVGADLSSVVTLRDLKQGLRACIRFLEDPR